MKKTARYALGAMAGATLIAGTALSGGPLTSSPAQAIPAHAHCGRESAGNTEGFVSHEQLVKELQKIERTSGGTVDLEVAGYTNEGREIYQARVGEGDTVIYVQSQIHGNEPHGTEAVINLLKTYGGNSKAAREIRENVTLVAVPMLNADGATYDQRVNAMTWEEAVADFPQLEGAEPSWNYRERDQGFDINRDFNPDLDYVPAPEDFPGHSGDTGWYITPEAQTSRDVYAALEAEFGIVDYFVDLHGQGNCYVADGTNDLSTLSISGRFIDDPTAHGDWPNFDFEASKKANVAVYEALQGRGNSAYGVVTAYPQDTDLPGTALGSFALRGSATVLFETSSQTQLDGQKRSGLLVKQVEEGLNGLITAVADGSIDGMDTSVYDELPARSVIRN